ncbi:hypothetical protein GCM10008179_04610 [Hansschlegelia plantiphila]|uniref:Cupin n=1 Tax=Hansschlegelia plantiphila TaxID=374655 RepID=A0A9W6MUF1_9HYPH|nr:hypothetical protein GCM10008179_04610 [Hansschlegelia plantiphila]
MEEPARPGTVVNPAADMGAPGEATALASTGESITTAEFRFASDGQVPNNPALSLLLHRKAFDAATPQPAITAEALFGANGWGGFWRDGVYDFHHYHSTCHEALGVASGWADIRFGGEHGETVRIEAGDVAVLPAGSGHKRLDASDDFLIVGAYPPDQPFDLIRASAAEHDAAVRRIAEVPLPATDPVFGPEGGLRTRWRKAG